jgi:hypothetical protein
MKGNRIAVLGCWAAFAGVPCGLLFVEGCGTPPPDAGMPPGALQSTADYDKRCTVPPKADAGVKVPYSTEIDTQKFATLIHSKSFSSRPDPFALLATERVFDEQQSAERLLQLTPFRTDYTPPVEPEPEIMEAQPYRRLAGVMVGDSISAIIDMGDGKGPQIIYPGERIPGTEWTVVSIDEDKAVLRRSGNRKPKEVVVPLAASLSGIIQPSSSGGGATTPGAGGMPRGGAPSVGGPGGPGRINGGGGGAGSD